MRLRVHELYRYMAVSMNERVLSVGVLMTRALPFHQSHG